MTSRSTRYLALASLLLSGPAAAQACPNASNTFFKNDSLPDVPGGSETIAVIPGLCVGEAAGTVFAFPAGAPPQRLTQVAVGIGSSGSFSALELDVEVYEGPVSFSGGAATLGTKVFDLGDLEESMTIPPGGTGIYTLDLTPYGVVVADDFVVAFRVVVNPNGTCSGGYSANPFTDAAACVAGIDLIDASGNGWIDPAAFPFFLGQTLCALGVYTGHWVIRACTEDFGVAASAAVRNGSGANPAVYASLTLPVIGTNWITTVDINQTGAAVSLVQLAMGGPANLPLAVGELLCAPPFLKPRSSGFGAHSIPVPNDPNLIGLALCTQAGGFTAPDQLELYNGIDIVVGL